MSRLALRATGYIAAVVWLTAALVPAPAARGAEPSPPILFVHGNGDSAALWTTIVWRFESNGYDPARLFAIDFTHPSARTDDTKPQENRSSTDDALRELGAKVAEIQARTGQKQVVLVGSSRGGNAIRNYIKFGGGAPNVSHAILGGTPNHGTQATNPNLNNEFHGAGPFLTRLNTPDEIVPGVRWMTIRSDTNDKYAQPDGRFVGMPGQPTGVTFAGPELRGADNVVLPGLDHREVAFHRLAFKAMYAFITGTGPRKLDPVPQAESWLDGLVSGYAGARRPTFRSGARRWRSTKWIPRQARGFPTKQRTGGRSAPTAGGDLSGPAPPRTTNSSSPPKAIRRRMSTGPRSRARAAMSTCASGRSTTRTRAQARS